MANKSRSTRQRLIQAALQLFASQGITETTTKQIAELADVNEVTLFRQFGNKSGLLLAVIEEAEVFHRLGAVLGRQANQMSSLPQALHAYSADTLQSLAQIPELVRSIIGEAGHYPVENRRALGGRITQANQFTAQYLATVTQTAGCQTHLAVEHLARLLNTLLLGYAVIQFTGDFEDSQDQEGFLQALVELFFKGAVVGASPVAVTAEPRASDLPTGLVHAILLSARKQGLQDFALAYVLFAAGLSASEVSGLTRSNVIQETQQCLLQITGGSMRQVPLLQWILGQRYGSANRNPVTQWIKSRKDSQAALFLNNAGDPISVVEVRLRWQTIAAELHTPEGQPPAIEQAQHTWRVEQLLKGLSLENLSLLSGQSIDQLQPYVRRAQEKAAVEQALRLDQKHASLEDATGGLPESR
jgi:AcrR family transcriptional regulator